MDNIHDATLDGIQIGKDSLMLSIQKYGGQKCTINFSNVESFAVCGSMRQVVMDEIIKISSVAQFEEVKGQIIDSRQSIGEFWDNKRLGDLIKNNVNGYIIVSFTGFFMDILASGVTFNAE